MPYKGFPDRAAHDRAHDLLGLPSWHPDAPPARTRRVLKDALRLCLRSPGYCDYDARRGDAGCRSDLTRPHNEA